MAMNFGNPLGIKYRVVKEVTHDGQPARIVSGSAKFDTHPQDLWDAVTNKERIPRWFLPISGSLKPGGRYQLEGNASGEIVQCKPPESFEITWEFGDNVSWVRMRLDADDGGTRLTLEHIMLKDESSEEHWRKYGPGATGVGWDLGFAGLNLHIRTEETIAQEEFHAWMATDAGKTFIRECSRAWAEAHIHSGEDESTANGMAQHTAGFYCGE